MTDLSRRRASDHSNALKEQARDAARFRKLRQGGNFEVFYDKVKIELEELDTALDVELTDKDRLQF